MPKPTPKPKPTPRPAAKPKPRPKPTPKPRPRLAARDGAAVGLDALTLDPANARSHPTRNLDVIRQSLTSVGAARSIVIDETGTVLAGEGVVKAARELGLNVRVIDTDAQTLIAVRRTGLSDDDKRRLAIGDNRAAELSAWDATVLTDQLSDLAPSPEALSLLGFSERELAELMPTDGGYSQGDPGAGEPGTGVDTIGFTFGDYRGRVSREVYEAFISAYSAQQDSTHAVLLDDVLRAWLKL
jgi:hypothetical protein